MSKCQSCGFPTTTGGCTNETCPMRESWRSPMGMVGDEVMLMGASVELRIVREENAALRARVVELEAQWDRDISRVTDAQVANVVLSARVTRLREALESIEERTSYPINDRDSFHEAMSRARRALEADCE